MYEMKCKAIILSALLVFCGIGSVHAQAGNTIEGTIVDEHNGPVYNAFVELYDQNQVMVNRARSSNSGRFTFRGLREGRFSVTVKPFGTDLMEDTQDVDIANVRRTSSEVFFVTFRLRIDKRFAPKDTGIVGTVFAQEVPPEAKRLYESGIKEMQSSPDKALADLGEAIKLFPNYFDALAALGKANIIRGKYADGYPYLLRALDVNKECSDCYYSLSLAFYKLDQLAAATTAIDAAVILQPKNPTRRLLQGMIYLANNDLKGAEKSLLLAKSLFEVPNPEVHYQLSLVYNKLKRNQEAADELEQYLKTKTDIDAAEKENVRGLIAKLRKAT